MVLEKWTSENFSLIGTETEVQEFIDTHQSRQFNPTSHDELLPDEGSNTGRLVQKETGSQED